MSWSVRALRFRMTNRVIVKSASLARRRPARSSFPGLKAYRQGWWEGSTKRTKSKTLP
jgi:hypothetical protein